MFKRILVPLDGSERAETAIQTAARLARANAGALIFVQVANLPHEVVPVVDAYAFSETAITMALDEAQAYLKSIRLRADLAGLATESDVLNGPVAEAIIAAAVGHQADVIVIASHGRTGVARWVLGSVAQTVARRSPVPVLVLRDARPDARAQAASQRPIFSVLVPLDGSPFAEEALAPAVALAGSLAGDVGARIRLVRVVDIPLPRLDPGTLTPTETIDLQTQRSLWNDAQRYLDGVAQRVRAALPPTSPIAVSYKVLFDIDTAEAIAAAAEGTRDPQGTVSPASDAIVMTTHGRSGLALWALGSITERVLARTTRQLLVVRPAEVRAQQAQQAAEAEEKQAAFHA